MCNQNYLKNISTNQRKIKTHVFRTKGEKYETKLNKMFFILLKKKFFGVAFMNVDKSTLGKWTQNNQNVGQTCYSSTCMHFSEGN